MERSTKLIRAFEDIEKEKKGKIIEIVSAVDDGIEIRKAETNICIKYVKSDHEQQKYQVHAEHITEYTNVLFAEEQPCHTPCQQKQADVDGVKGAADLGPGKQEVKIVGRNQNEQKNTKIHRLMLSTFPATCLRIAFRNFAHTVPG